jgi:hypothetical protein
MISGGKGSVIRTKSLSSTVNVPQQDFPDCTDGSWITQMNPESEGAVSESIAFLPGFRARCRQSYQVLLSPAIATENAGREGSRDVGVIPAIGEEPFAVGRRRPQRKQSIAPAVRDSFLLREKRNLPSPFPFPRRVPDRFPLCG